MDSQPKPTTETPDVKAPPARPQYEPPRITKKRSVSRATLFSGGGPPSMGLTGTEP